MNLKVLLQNIVSGYARQTKVYKTGRNSYLARSGISECIELSLEIFSRMFAYTHKSFRQTFCAL